MKKLFVAVLCLVMSTGCLFGPPKPGEDQTAYTQQIINQGKMAVAVASGVFEGLCEENVFGLNDCAVGRAAITVYNSDLAAMEKVFTDYKLGVVDSASLQAATKSFTKSVAAVLLALRSPDTKQLQANERQLERVRTMRLKGDLGKPTGSK